MHGFTMSSTFTSLSLASAAMKTASDLADVAEARALAVPLRIAAVLSGPGLHAGPALTKPGVPGAADRPSFCVARLRCTPLVRRWRLA